MNRFRLAAFFCALSLFGSTHAETPHPVLPLFDTHLHYNWEPAPHLPLDQVLALLRAQNVTGILATSRPNDEALEILFRHDPQAKIIWAHTGFSTAPEKVESYLQRYPTLWCELSYRYGITDGGGRLTPEWQRLFEKYPDRFLVGSDTWVDERWDSYAAIMGGYRQWLAQLPPAVAEQIAFRNGERLFK